VANLQRAGQTRGAAIARLNEALLRDLRAPGTDMLRVYEDYLAARNAGYMQTESGGVAPARASPWAELTGYDKIALSVVRAIHFDQRIVLPLNVPNRGNVSDLDAEDIVEVPCLVGANGARPLHVGAPPAAARDLMLRVKDYERATVRAALSQSMDLALEALVLNPLVESRELARTLLGALAPLA
jgi:6-phospho-beta-glucosidase